MGPPAPPAGEGVTLRVMSDLLPSSRPRILVANDDGIFSPGIKALGLALAEVGDVVVVAPDVEQSAVGHGITIRRPLRFKHTASAGFGDIPAYRVDGTPADCVVLGVHLLGRPDLVVSGINLGPNLGDDLTHSGTVAAAIEGLALGLPAIALSQRSNGGEYDFAPSAAYAARLAREVLARGLPPDAFAEAVNARSAGVMGPLVPVGPRQLWPVLTRIADRLTARRTALMAEAAHVVPPIGAQGLNMSLADLRTLMDLARSRPEAIGSEDWLAAYARQREGDIRLRAAGIALLNRASMAGALPLVALRGLGLRALHGVRPVRHGLMRLGLRAGG